MNRLDQLLEHGPVRFILALLIVALAFTLVIVTAEGWAAVESLAFAVKHMAEGTP